MSNYVGKEQAVKVGEKEYRLSRLTREVWSDFGEWAKPLMPNVLTTLAAHIDSYPPAIQAEMASQAVRMAQEPMERRVQELLDTPSGFAKMVHLLLKEHHPDVSESEAFDVANEIKAQALELLVKAQGVMPGNPSGGEADL